MMVKLVMMARRDGLHFVGDMDLACT